MFRNYHNSKRSSVNTANTVQRWQSIIFALALVLMIGNTSQTPKVHAAPDDPADVAFEVVAYPESPPPLCINQKLKIYVSVNKVIHKTINSTEWVLPRGGVTGVTVRASMSNPGIGELTPPEFMVDQGQAALGPSQVAFLFTAKKRGETTLIFNSEVGIGWVAADSEDLARLGKGIPAKKAEIRVKVRNCKYKVKTIGEWHVPGEANIFIAAVSDDAEVKADEQGSYTGSAAVNWAASAGRVGDCVGTFTIGSSRVNWTGEQDDSDQLTINGNYQLAEGSISAVCTADGSNFGTDGGVGTGGFQAQLTPDPVQVSMLAAGGVIQQSQVLQWEGPTPGSVTIVVIPEEDEAVAFLPDIPNSIWDNFSSLLGTLLALR